MTVNPADTRECDGYPGLVACTCTLACIPQGITEGQTCRMAEASCTCGDDPADCSEAVHA